MIKIRLKSRPWEIVEVYEHQLLDLQRWGSILEYVDDEDETPEDVARVWTYEELQEYFSGGP